MSDPNFSFSSPTLVTHLDEQYQCIENYCNARTKFNNVRVDSKLQYRTSISQGKLTMIDALDRLEQSVAQVQTARRKVQDNWRKLLEMKEMMNTEKGAALSKDSAVDNIGNFSNRNCRRQKRMLDLLNQHLKRTERVVTVILEESSTLDDVLIAFASLRASIANVKEILVT